MILKSLSLQNFRNYQKADYQFDPGVTIIVGSNASGKSNLIEAIYLLATGKSRRTEQDIQLIHFGDQFCRVRCLAGDELEAVISLDPEQKLKKKYLVNGVAKRRIDFAGRLSTVLFTPLDLDIALGAPSGRRRFLDEILDQADYEYRYALTSFTKGLRQRNALLEQVQKTGIRNEKLFVYWNDLLIKNGQIITAKREELITYINNQKKELFPFTLVYDKSIISEDRLLQYRDAEIGSGVTLVGPHRDDFKILAFQEFARDLEDVKYFSSRGQQRLVVLELKLSQISYLTERNRQKPLLLLDDIFSELDESHIRHIFTIVHNQQTIITTTHEDFIPKKLLPAARLIKLAPAKS